MSDTPGYGMALLPQHQQLLADSAISVDVARERGYVSVDTKAALGRFGFPVARRQVPALLIPVWDVKGARALNQYRPDTPRVVNGKVRKYETQSNVAMALDVPPRVRARIGDPTVPLWITEGVRKADSAVTADLCCVALLGVWNWRGRNSAGGKTALPDWESVALKGRTVYIAFDSDAVLKQGVHDAMSRLGAFLAGRGAEVGYVYLNPKPDGGKVGLDDFFAAGGKVGELVRCARPQPLRRPDDAEPKDVSAAHLEPIRPVTWAQAIAVFQRWLHLEDTDVVLAAAGAAAGNRAPGEPVWMLIIAQSSGGKTEILNGLGGLPDVHIVGSITGDAALLSASPRKDRAPEATGGLLRVVGDFGILVNKDFSSVLAMHREARDKLLAAFRLIYDGEYTRDAGADGATKLTWRGKCGFIGACTPSYDNAHAVIHKLGDRFILIRPWEVPRAASTRMALRHGMAGERMREELSAAMSGLVAGANLRLVGRELDDDELTLLSDLADYATRARTGVERNGYTHEVEVIPIPEGPQRFAKQLRQLYGGLEAIGCDRETAARVVSRVARDSVPAVRTTLIGHLVRATEPMRTSALAAKMGMAAKTTARHLADLVLLGLAVRVVTEDPDSASHSGAAYSWAASIELRRLYPREPEGGTETSDPTRPPHDIPDTRPSLPSRQSTKEEEKFRFQPRTNPQLEVDGPPCELCGAPVPPSADGFAPLYCPPCSEAVAS